MHLLIRARAPAHGHRGRVRRRGRAAMIRARDFIELRKAHEDDERFGRADFGPVDLRDVMASDEGDDRGVIAMRERNAGISRDAQRRGNARHHFERQCPASASASASSPPRPKINGSPPFSRTTFRPRLAALDQQRADLFLRKRVVRFLLADVDAFGGAGARSSSSQLAQVVVEDRVGLFEQAFAL